MLFQIDFSPLPRYHRREETKEGSLSMQLGNSLASARKKSGFSQEEVAERLGVSRQTILKWESSETLPDIRQSKQLAVLYHLTLDALIDFDLDQAVKTDNDKLTK